MNSPEASIVVASHNEGLNLYLTLHAIDESADVSYEVIVVDDGSTDGSADFLRAYSSDRHRLLNSPLAGPAHARNIGANAARSDVLVFLDAHCFPRRGWLSKLISEVRSHPNDLITGCICAAGSPLSRGCGLTIVSPTFDVQWLPETISWHGRVPLAGAACMAIGTRRFFAVGGFYPFRVIGLEDVELCLRLWAMGGAVRVAEGVEVIHIFADRWRKSVQWADYYLNGIIISWLHLDDERLRTSLSEFAQLPGSERALRSLDHAGMAREREIWRRRFTRDFDSFCEEYQIAWNAQVKAGQTAAR